MQEKAPFVVKAEKLKAEYNKKINAYNNKVCSTPKSSPHLHLLTVPAHSSLL
jgi:hypothetical protein